MKFSGIQLLCLWCTLAFSGWGQEGAIHFTVKNPPSREAVLGYYYGGKQYICGNEKADGSVENIVLSIDDKGKTTFYKKDLPQGIYLLVFQPGNEYLEFIYEGNTLELSFDMQDVMGTIQSNSKANNAHFSRLNYVREIEKRLEGKDEAEKASIIAEHDLYQDKFLADNANNLAGKMVKASLSPKIPKELTDQNTIFYYYRAHYFDNFDFSAPWLLRTPFFEEKINTYLNDLTVPQPDSLIDGWERLLRKATANDEVFKYLLIKAVNLYASSKVMGQDALYVHFVDNYYLRGLAPWIEEDALAKMRERVDKMRNCLIGKTAKDFEIRDAEGKITRLHELQSEYIVLLFVTEDCTLCRREEDVLKGQMQEWPEDVLLVEVVLHANDEQLASYTSDLAAPWEVYTPSGTTGSACSDNYDLYSTPRIYLLDRDKQILLKQLGAEKVREALDYIRE